MATRGHDDEYGRYFEQTIFMPIDGFLAAVRADLPARSRFAPFAVLYLQWEARHPAAWGSPASALCSPWTLKYKMLRKFGRDGVTDNVRAPAADLIVAAVRRRYRRMDWMYARMVQHVHDAEFARRIEALLDARDPLVRLRAQFVLYVARHPEQTIKRQTWRRWLDANRLTVPERRWPVRTARTSRG